MSRIALDMWEQRLEAAYRGDPFHALRKNIEGVHADEWDLKPSRASVQKEGALGHDELSICDQALHAGGAKYMYADRIFGDAALDWPDIKPPASRDMAPVLAWMDEGHRQLAEGLAALQDDALLLEERPAPWRVPMRRNPPRHRDQPRPLPLRRDQPPACPDPLLRLAVVRATPCRDAPADGG